MKTDRQKQQLSGLDEPPLAPVLEFDITCINKPGLSRWPEKHFGQKFGPTLIKNALKAGYYVMAEVQGFPRPVPIYNARWDMAVLEVLTAEGYRIPDRVFTLASLKGFKL